MHRYIVYQFDASTFLVIDVVVQREICICANYDDYEDAKERAEKIVLLLNQNSLRERFEIRICQRKTALVTGFRTFSPLNWHFQANWRSSLFITR